MIDLRTLPEATLRALRTEVAKVSPVVDLSDLPVVALRILRDEVVKYSPDQPRDEAGRWTSGGGFDEAAVKAQLAARNLYVDFKGMAPEYKPMVTAAVNRWRDHFPDQPSLLVKTSTYSLGARAQAETQGYAITLSTEWFGQDGPSNWTTYEPMDRARGWSAVPGPEGVVWHELGHVVDWMDYFGGASAMAAAGGSAMTGSGSRNPQERFAEAFSLLFNPPDQASRVDPGDVVKVSRYLDSQNATTYVKGLTTKVLLAARAILKFDPSADELTGPAVKFVGKYSEDEPRDDRGRWTAGAPDSRAVDDGRKAWVGRWYDDNLYVKDYHTEIRNALAGVTPELRPGEFPVHPANAARWLAQGEALLGAIAHSEPTITPLYRGMAVSAEDAARLQAIKAGEVIDLNLASWSSEKGTAEKFMLGQGGYTGRTGSQPVFLTMVGDKRALDVGFDTPLPYEKEWLSNGRFEVVNAFVGEPLGQYGEPVINLFLHQTDVFTSAVGTAGTKILKYSPDQPRDSAGRWTSGGGDTGSTDIRERNAGAWTAYRLSVRPGKRDKLGNCYQASGRMMMDRRYLGLKDPILVHATVTGQGSVAGRPFGHAWVEAEDPAGYGIRAAYDYSNGREIMLPAALYRQIGNARDVHEYSPKDATVEMVRTGHYGPWT